MCGGLGTHTGSLQGKAASRAPLKKRNFIGETPIFWKITTVLEKFRPFSCEKTLY